MRYLGTSNDFTVPVTPTSIPPGSVIAGQDTNQPTNGTFGNGVNAAGPYDLGPMSERRTAVSDLGLLSQAAGSAINLGLLSA